MIHWREDKSARWFVLEYVDPYTFAEWRTAVTAVIGEASWSPVRRLLVDRSHCAAPSTEFVRQMETFLVGHRDEFRGARVAVLTATDVGYGMTRMHEILADVDALPMALQAFRDREAAEEWLQSPGHQPHP